MQPTGGTYRDHLQAAEEQTGETIAELHPDPPPLELRHIWDVFAELSGTRPFISAGMGGAFPAPLPYSEIDAWCRLTGCYLSGWEIRALKAVDAAYLAAQSASKPTHRDNPPQ